VGADDETYPGRGATQDDGRLMALLTDGEREMRVSKVAFRTLASGTPAFELLSEDWEGSRSRHSRTTGPAVRGAAGQDRSGRCA